MNDTATDFDLHHILGIHLVDATPAEVAAVGRQVGLKSTTLARPADITIRFVDRLALSGPVTYLNMGEAGFTPEAFLVLRSKHKVPARVMVDFAQIGSPEGLTITCEHGLPAVPLLIAMINLTMLKKGALPLHASAFVYNGVGVLATGWSKGGKTELLLACAAQGATYIGDEWVYIHPDGRSMHGIPEPVRLWNWHLESMPTYRAQVSGGDRRKLDTLQAALKVEKTLTRGPGKKLFGRFSGRVQNLLKKQQHVDIPPAQLFGDRVQPADATATLEKVFFVSSHDSPEVSLTPMDAKEVAARMVASLQYEQLPFWSYYLQYRFAFPERRSTLVEESETLQRERLLAFLDGKESYRLAHPYPVHLPALFEAVCPYLERK